MRPAQKSGLFDAGPEPLALEKVDLRQGAHVVAYDGPPHVWGQDSSVVSLKIVGYNTKALRSFPLRSFRTMASQHCRHLYVFCLAARAGVSRQHSGLFLNGLPDRHFPSTAKKSRWETFRFPAGLSRPYFLDGPQEQALLRHTKRSAYCCFLPDLTRFTASYCAGPKPCERNHQKAIYLYDYIMFEKPRQGVCSSFQSAPTSPPPYISHPHMVVLSQSGSLPNCP